VNSPAATDSSPKPTGIWNTLLTSLPVGLTVLATAFAGLSSSEMTQAMYYRSLAAQHQSKAGDQWAFFQAKRIRGTNLETTAELLQSLGNPAPFAPDELDSLLANLLTALEKPAVDKGANDSLSPEKADQAVAAVKTARVQLAKLLKDDTVKASLPYLTGSTLPKAEILPPSKTAAQDEINAVIDAIRQRKTETETAGMFRTIKADDIDEATRRAEQNGDLFDKACAPVNDTIKRFRSLFAELASALRPWRNTGLLTALDNEEKGFRWAVLEFDSKRYQHESVLNRAAAEAYEVRVRLSGVESDRRRQRSMMFFYSMLMAQAGVTVASLALAGTQRKALWLFAALAGLIALGFSGYVYLSF
jgi:Domain of unknown function (DUF4337)